MNIQDIIPAVGYPPASVLLAWDPATNRDVGWLTLACEVEGDVVGRLQYRLCTLNELADAETGVEGIREVVSKGGGGEQNSLCVPEVNNDVTKGGKKILQVKGVQNLKEKQVKQQRESQMQYTAPYIPNNMSQGLSTTRQVISNPTFSGHLQNMYKQDLEIKKVICAHCGDAVVSIRKHRMDCSSSTEVCNMCGGKYRNKKLLQNHIYLVHRKAGYKPKVVCAKCDVALANKVSLERHMVSKHGEKWQIKCRRCKVIVRVKANLVLHNLSCLIYFSTIQQQVCKVCSKTFTRYNLLKHQKSVHKFTPVPVQCKICGCKVSSAIHEKHEELCAKEL